MNEKEFVEDLWKRYHDLFETPIQAIRRTWYGFPIGSEKWLRLALRGARLEWDFGELIARGLTTFPDLDRWLIVKYARQAYDEYKHYALLADFLKGLGHDIEHPYKIPETPVRNYYARLLSRKSDFVLFGLAEKVPDNTYREYSEVTNDQRWKEITKVFNRDEAFHISFLNERLRAISRREEGRALVEKYFLETWRESLRGNVVFFAHLGIDVASILADFPKTADYLATEFPGILERDTKEVG